jgi:DTW domain-containing protein
MQEGVDPESFEPRAICTRCRRPAVVCYCKFVTPITTKTRVVILQHPRERDVPINTARIAALCLPEAEIHVGVKVPALPSLSDPARPAILLYPDKDAVDIFTRPPAGPVTLVVVDGTWSQARSVVNKNPALQALPRYAFAAPEPSEYQIRREPRAEYMSTIEALVSVLSTLEGDPALMQTMLAPFRAMVQMQVDYINNHHNVRHTYVRRARPGDTRKRGEPALRIPYVMRDRPQDLVCVTAEANAWPYDAKEYGPHELVQWSAQRMHTGEVFEAFIAPRRELCPTTPGHMQITGEQIRAGLSIPDFLAQWQAFLKPNDILCFWGPYARSLLDSAKAEVNDSRSYVSEVTIDLREVVRTKLALGGSMQATGEKLSSAPRTVVTCGRSGKRLAELAIIASALLEP